MKLPTVPSMGVNSPPLSGANTGYIVQTHADDAIPKEATADLSCRELHRVRRALI